MVDKVTEAATTFAPIPARLEAGTPDFAGAVALGAAICYLEDIGGAAIAEQEEKLLCYAETKLKYIKGLHILGKPRKRIGAISFWMEGIHSYDLASMLDKFGIAVRSGSHCAQPALHSFGISEAVRVSSAFYNTMEEIDLLCAGIEESAALL